MTEHISLYTAALQKVNWLEVDQFKFPDEITSAWVTEQGSLSRRLSEAGEGISVELINNQWIPLEGLTEEEKLLLADGDCLQREVVLRGKVATGHEQDWLIGRTLIPQSSMEAQPFNLASQGEVPLGLTLFSADDVERDALQVGWAYIQGEDIEDRTLIARRSRIWVNRKPVLVAELFLPDSPVYRKGEQS
jgi:chorismate--pyruvate lyase